MKRALILISLSLLLLLPLLSAEATIIIDQQPKALYNYGERINLPITVTSNQGVFDFLQVTLLCGSLTHEFPKDSLDIFPGEVKKIDKSVLLIKRFIGETKGTCKIRAGLEDDVGNYILSNEFRISNLITAELELEKTSFKPSDVINLNGIAAKENGGAVEGIVEVKVLKEENTFNSYQGIVTNGAFSVNIELPDDMEASTYILEAKVHETDPLGEITNLGSSSSSIEVVQVPTNLEIIFETQEVEPGTNMRVKTILHDQTGESIPSVSTLQIKNNQNKIVSQEAITTEEFFEFPIKYDQAPSLWEVTASSEDLTTDLTFSVIEKESIEMTLINKTLSINNTGNVPYNETTLVKIGEETINLPVYLEVGESQKYLISAPDGQYRVEVIAGESTVSQEVALTGKAIDVKKASATAGVRNSFVWIFIIILLGFVALLAYKRGYQKTFIGYISSKIRRDKGGDAHLDNVQTVHKPSISESALIIPGNRAEVSLSIKGDKQDVSVVAITVKNSEVIQSKKGNAKETLQSIVSIAEEYRASTYEGRNTIFFILAPERTRTFKNEKTALEIAKKAKEILTEHNKKFEQKINYGMSLNHGSMIVKQEKNILKFMSLGTLMNSTKKISSLADKDVLLSEKMNDKLISYLKTSKHDKNGIVVYSIKEMKKGTEENKEFLKSFLNRNKSS